MRPDYDDRTITVVETWRSRAAINSRRSGCRGCRTARYRASANRVRPSTFDDAGPVGVEAVSHCRSGHAEAGTRADRSGSRRMPPSRSPRAIPILFGIFGLTLDRQALQANLRSDASEPVRSADDGRDYVRLPVRARLARHRGLQHRLRRHRSTTSTSGFSTESRAEAPKNPRRTLLEWGLRARQRRGARSRLPTASSSSSSSATLRSLNCAPYNVNRATLRRDTGI